MLGPLGGGLPRSHKQTFMNRISTPRGLEDPSPFAPCEDTAHGAYKPEKQVVPRHGTCLRTVRTTWLCLYTTPVNLAYDILLHGPREQSFGQSPTSYND